MTYSLVSNGNKGKATITNATTGCFIYTPVPNVNGTDSFTFTASGGLVDSRLSTVTVTINPVNDAPVANGTCDITYQAQAIKGTLGGIYMESPHLLIYRLNADGSGGRDQLLRRRAPR